MLFGWYKKTCQGTWSLQTAVTICQVQHQFWLAKNPKFPDIIGLDLLDRWGPVGDVSSAVLHLDIEAIAIHKSSNFCPKSAVTHDVLRSPYTPQLPSPETKRGCQWPILDEQQHQLKEQAFIDVFGIRDEDCTHTNLVLYGPPSKKKRGGVLGRYHQAL